VRQEYALLRRISATEVVRALALDEWQGLPALVLALVDGTPLSAWIRRPHGAADLVERLRLALGLTRAVAAVHAARSCTATSSRATCSSPPTAASC
jgi:hypothetical protein